MLLCRLKCKLKNTFHVVKSKGQANYRSQWDRPSHHHLHWHKKWPWFCSWDSETFSQAPLTMLLLDTFILSSSVLPVSLLPGCCFSAHAIQIDDSAGWPAWPVILAPPRHPAWLLSIHWACRPVLRWLELLVHQNLRSKPLYITPIHLRWGCSFK